MLQTALVATRCASLPRKTADQRLCLQRSYGPASKYIRRQSTYPIPPTHSRSRIPAYYCNPSTISQRQIPNTALLRIRYNLFLELRPPTPSDEINWKVCLHHATAHLSDLTKLHLCPEQAIAHPNLCCKTPKEWKSE